LLVIALGVVAFLLRAREVRQWPFAAVTPSQSEGA
jgi:hypothetical protein